MTVKADDLSRAYAVLLETFPWTGDGGDGTAVPEGNESTPPSPMRIVEALLFVGGAPLTAQRVGEIIRGFSAEQFTQALDALNHAYRLQNRPYAILARGEGYTLALRPKYRGVMEKIYGGQRE